MNRANSINYPSCISSFIDKMEKDLKNTWFIVEKLQKIDTKIGKIRDTITKTEAKLNNPQFIKNAPQNIIDKNAKRLDELRRELRDATKTRTAERLRHLGN